MNVQSKDIISEARALMPGRPLIHGEALMLAERQALLLLKLLKIKEAPVDVFRLAELPSVSVKVEPRYKMNDLAGYATMCGSKSVIIVNENDAPARRRFTLAHEFKHVLDDPLRDTIYDGLGLGDDELKHRAIERISDHFAACFLMPRAVVKRAWLSGIQHPESLAGVFNVSPAAMTVRLRHLGLTNTRKQPTREYFRHTGGHGYAARPPSAVRSSCRGRRCLAAVGRGI